MSLDPVALHVIQDGHILITLENATNMLARKTHSIRLMGRVRRLPQNEPLHLPQYTMRPPIHFWQLYLNREPGLEDTKCHQGPGDGWIDLSGITATGDLENQATGEDIGITYRSTLMVLVSGIMPQNGEN